MILIGALHMSRRHGAIAAQLGPLLRVGGS